MLSFDDYFERDILSFDLHQFDLDQHSQHHQLLDLNLLDNKQLLQSTIAGNSIPPPTTTTTATTTSPNNNHLSPALTTSLLPQVGDLKSTLPSFDSSLYPFCFDWILQQSFQHQPIQLDDFNDLCVNPSLAASIPSNYTPTLSPTPSLSSPSPPTTTETLSPSLTDSSIININNNLGNINNNNDNALRSSLSSSSSCSSEETQSGPIRKYKCPICPRAFARQFNLKQHIQTHDPDRVKPHECTYNSCGRRFSRKHDLVRHSQSIHGIPGPPTKSSKNHSPQDVANMIAKRQNARKKSSNNSINNSNSLKIS